MEAELLGENDEENYQWAHESVNTSYYVQTMLEQIFDPVPEYERGFLDIFGVAFLLFVRRGFLEVKNCLENVIELAQYLSQLISYLTNIVSETEVSDLQQDAILRVVQELFEYETIADQDAQEQVNVEFLYQDAQERVNGNVGYQDAQERVNVEFLYQDAQGVNGNVGYQEAHDGANVEFLYQDAQEGVNENVGYQDAHDGINVDFFYQDKQEMAYGDFLHQDTLGLPENFAYQNAQERAYENVPFHDSQERVCENVARISFDYEYDDQHMFDTVQLLFNSVPEIYEEHHRDVQDDTDHQSNNECLKCGHTEEILQETTDSKQSQEEEHNYSSFGNTTFTHQSIPTNNTLPYIIPVR